MVHLASICASNTSDVLLDHRGELSGVSDSLDLTTLLVFHNLQFVNFIVPKKATERAKAAYVP